VAILSTSCSRKAKTLGNRAFASDFVNPPRGTTSRSSATGCAGRFPKRRRRSPEGWVGAAAELDSGRLRAGRPAPMPAEHRENKGSPEQSPLFFTFPEDARWNADRQAVEFRVEIGEHHGGPGAAALFQSLLPERPTPERSVEAYYLQRTRFESIAERKLRRRQLTEDGNVEISGRDLRRCQKPGSSRGCKR
jgi:hypothetical protein